MRLLIVDNESNIREGIVHMVAEYCPEITEIIQADGVATGLQQIELKTPDVLLLDVELDDGTGMDLLTSLNKVNFEVIFITAHDKYAVEAFKFSAVDFLTKPIDPSDLRSAIEKVLERKAKNSLAEQIEVLQANMNKLTKGEKIVLKDINSIYFVDVSDIIRCQSDAQYTEFHLVDQKKIVVSRTLKEYEELLTPFGFIRTHHSHLINVKKIVRFDKADGGTLILQNNQQVPISQRKKAAILSLLENL